MAYCTFTRQHAQQTTSNITCLTSRQHATVKIKPRPMIDTTVRTFGRHHICRIILMLVIAISHSAALTCVNIDTISTKLRIRLFLFLTGFRSHTRPKTVATEIKRASRQNAVLWIIIITALIQSITRFIEILASIHQLTQLPSVVQLKVYRKSFKKRQTSKIWISYIYSVYKRCMNKQMQKCIRLDTD